MNITDDIQTTDGRAIATFAKKWKLAKVSERDTRTAFLSVRPSVTH